MEKAWNALNIFSVSDNVHLTTSLKLIHLDVGDSVSLVADDLGYSLQYLLFCVKLEAAYNLE